MSNRSSGGPKKPSSPKLGKLGQKPRASKPADKPFAFEEDDRPRLNAPRREKLAQPMNDMRLGEFTVDRLGHDGRGIASWNGKTLFIESALVGERVSARLVQDHSRYAEARIDKLIEPAPERVAPLCAHYAECGGCQLQHLEPAAQLAFKQNAVLEQLALWGGVKPKHLLAPVTSAYDGYRRCARLGTFYGDEGVTLGFRQRNSHKLVAVNLCLVLAPELNKLLAPLTQWLERLDAAKAVTHVELISAEGLVAVVLRHTLPLASGDLHSLDALAGQYGFTAWLQGDDKQLTDTKGNQVDPRLSYALPQFDMTLEFHPNDFIQVNPEVNAKMVAQALKLMALKGTERVLDLFCGIGNFTLPIARHCAQVVGIEAVDAMVERGRENAARLGITNAEFVAANLLTMSDKRLRDTCGKVDAVLLDPPRDGAREILAKLAQLSPKRIVYVSCNPATLARDAKILTAAGYQLDSAGVLDMFPHTAHVESMALFVRR